MKDYEIIVVNNGERLTEENHLMCKKYGVKEIRVNRTIGAVAARNLGFAEAKGEVIAVFDDDAFPKQNWFKEVMPLFRNPAVGAAGGLELKTTKTSFAERIFHQIWFVFAKPGSVTASGNVVPNVSTGADIVEVDHLHGSNFAFSKTALKKVKGFDPFFVGHHRDETDFVYRIKKAGFKVLLNSRTGAIHGLVSVGGSVPPERKREWAYWYNRNNALFFFKDVYDGSLLRLALFFVREAFFSLYRAIVNSNIHYLLQFGAYFEGRELAKRRSK
jgi:GT2 family glycosyltransferase